ncbi:hypothetical protein AGMMS49940_16500 [Spirochaetia bacterium]|nr:hypothetical protein AGMMS49940_16500 [Spirochaetia bacterium]
MIGRQYSVKCAIFGVVFMILPFLANAQAKYALVIGNGAYTEGAPLKNAVNDANDITAALQGLGFTVDKLLNASLNQMEDAAVRLKNRLSVSTDSYGFFFYAGHGVQADGINYLLPVDARIPEKSFLKTKAFAIQPILDMLNDSGNALNVIVLDACRDLPMAWSRSVDRGLSVVSRQPAKSIIMYATAAGKTASDGTGRNGLFTQHLLTNLKTPGLDVKEVFNRTGEAVANASNYTQLPAIYLSFYGTAYLGNAANVKDFQWREERGTVTITGYTGSVKDIFIPTRIDGMPVTGIGASAFYDIQLASVILPNGITFIGEDSFADNNLTSVTLPYSVSSIGGGAFHSNKKLTSIAVDPQNQYYTIVDGILYNKNRTKLHTVPAGKHLSAYTIPNSVTSIEAHAFCDNYLTSITIPNSVTSIGAHAFCRNQLTSFYIPNSVSFIGYMAFDDDFNDFYDNNRKRAGTYSWNGSRWSYR